MDLAPGVASTNKFDKPVHTWRDIPGWFQWRHHQEEAVAHFPDARWFVEVGCYLGRSICSLGEVVRDAGLDITIIGRRHCAGQRAGRPRRTTTPTAPPVDHGGGTFAGLLHRNIIDCGLAETVQLVISDSVAAADLFADASLAWVHIDARHDYESVVADVNAWAPKVTAGRLVVRRRLSRRLVARGGARRSADTLPDAVPWGGSIQWRWIKPGV